MILRDPTRQEIDAAAACQKWLNENHSLPHGAQLSVRFHTGSNTLKVNGKTDKRPRLEQRKEILHHMVNLPNSFDHNGKSYTVDIGDLCDESEEPP